MSWQWTCKRLQFLCLLNNSRYIPYTIMQHGVWHLTMETISLFVWTTTAIPYWSFQSVKTLTNNWLSFGNVKSLSKMIKVMCSKTGKMRRPYLYYNMCKSLLIAILNNQEYDYYSSETCNYLH